MEQPEKYFENFAIMIPKFATHFHNGCIVVNASGEEWVNFMGWLDKQKFLQLSAGDIKMDLWARNNDLVLDHIALSLQKLFDHWKENPPKENEIQYSFHTFKSKKQ